MWSSAAANGMAAQVSGFLSRVSRRVGQVLLAGALVAGLGNPVASSARESVPTGMPTIERADLPPQGKAVLEKIETGATFRHEKDGSVFGNRERLLPRQTRGYYREYTVRTPGVKHRGARRIVCGGEVPSTPDACYYTEDHYASFKRIVP
jgi:ribonuclease T1